MKLSLKFITLIVYKYIHVCIYICITGGPYLSIKSVVTDKVSSVDGIELNNAGKQATIWVSAHWCLFSMHVLATSAWVSPLVFCVPVIWHSQESGRRHHLSTQGFEKEIRGSLETGRATLSPSWRVAVLTQPLQGAPLSHNKELSLKAWVEGTHVRNSSKDSASARSFQRLQKWN